MTSSEHPTPAATVVLVRDGQAGLEVFMLKRHLDSDFVGGAYVFPGGKVDEKDLEMPLGTTMPDADEFGVAAVRETFEESGVLLAHRNGVPVSDELPATRLYQDARSKLASRSNSWDWRPWLVQEQLTLNRLDWYAWWVTPAGVHRRFDTRFFIAACPPNQVAHHDGVETTDSMWTRPKEALTAQARGEVSIILPTRKNLASLVGFPMVQDVLDHVSQSGLPARIEPTIVPSDGEPMVDHPSFDRPEVV